MKSLGQLAEDFFKQHQEQLEYSYPGINPRKIQELFLQERQLAFRDLDPVQALFSASDFSDATQKLLSGKPIAHLYGGQWFYSHFYRITPGVLCPRNETEGLVELVMKNTQGKVESAADWGCGSGVVGLQLLALGLECQHMHFVDVSSTAIELTQTNAKALRFQRNADTQVSFHQQSFFDWEGELDLIVSNPPYILRERSSQVHATVEAHEPHTALYVDQDFFAQFSETLWRCLKPGGAFYMECDDLSFDYYLEQFSTRPWDQLELIKDLAGRNRYLKGRKSKE